MLELTNIKVEQCAHCITDADQPRISFALCSDQSDIMLDHAVIQIGDWSKTVREQIGILYEGKALEPFTEYTVHIRAYDQKGNCAEGSATFATGRKKLPWRAQWISDPTYQFGDTESPVPFTFRKQILCTKRVKKAFVVATAWGIYELGINQEKIGNEFFAPGFTSYRHQMQYNVYPVTNLKEGTNEICAVVGGGWAVGRSTYIYDTNKSFSKIDADFPALLLELYVEYEDGASTWFVTDDSWEVTQYGNYRFGDFYDGEFYDATIDFATTAWKQAKIIHSKHSPELRVRYGEPVTAHEVLTPCACTHDSEGRLIYDFGQNMAGVVRIELTGSEGQRIQIRHAEVLDHGSLYTESLRSAKATLTYICRAGKQVYMPRLTYMGFRYVEVTGIEEGDISSISAVALYSDMELTGSFRCSDADLNQLQSNVVWSGKSNFIDIPTDCPQRDERQGWTGDIALFASTACFNFDMSRFLEKWLIDLKSDQSSTGAIPFVIPKRGSKTPAITTSCWGDSCIIVPWALYRSRGDKTILQRQFPCMQKYMRSVRRWAMASNLFRKSSRVWAFPFQFGDWCAPYGSLPDWFRCGKWVGTAYWANSCHIMSKICAVLGETKEQRKYEQLFREICRDYERIFTNGKGELNKEFQTGYVLPLYFHMFGARNGQRAAERLWKLILEADMHLNTGFTATPYLLFALSDWGKEHEAFELLFQDTNPSWLYQIRKGGTTFWEQWDTVKTDGTLKSASMNHYAYGAVGDFFYRRICGLEPVEAGYKVFAVKPHMDMRITWAECSYQSPYGKIYVKWEHVSGSFRLTLDVPVSAACEIEFPSGRKEHVGSGHYEIEDNNGEFY